jgi:hypothetical protein
MAVWVRGTENFSYVSHKADGIQKDPALVRRAGKQIEI